ncbi:MAG: VOC family protein [Flavobacterium sp. MedPE-SWcel]|uniref:VOC family protein n=1 Tax=uncultured Flavobacterium sp. TaxID=165435 RepID=UPI00091C6349|nr:VOC family protein [uncultured Flavobacterium sp.]OIQ20113.1 MAG: VOC family protein [Flavobacterium sp. MedPE-SWcel]
MTQINPYIAFNGNCEEAFSFYKSVFGGEFTHIGRFKDMPCEEDQKIPEEDAEKIMHVSLPIGTGTTIMGCDSSDSFGKNLVIGNNITISINVDNEAEAHRIFNGLSDSGNIMMPLNKTFWAALFGMFTDKFGINWMINCE